MDLVRQVWLRFKQRLGQIKKSFERQPWKDKVTSKIILKVIAQQHSEKKHHPASALALAQIKSMVERISLMSSSCRFHITTWLSRPFARKPRAMLGAISRQARKLLQYPTSLVFFLFLYLLIWHPGLHSRYIPEDPAAQTNIIRIIPPRPKIYPLDQVKLQINCASGWVAFFMRDKKIACYPAHISFRACGKYKISDLRKIEGNGMIALLTPEKTSAMPLTIKGASSGATFRLRDVGYCIELDDDYWEILFPYLRINTAVAVH